MDSPSKYPKLIFFDGVCGLCNTFVDSIIKRDHQDVFKFTALQSDLSQKELPAEIIKNLDTVVYKRDGQVYTQSSAALMILSDLGGIYSLAKLALIVPKFIRNSIYKWIAKNRYKWFGKKEACRMPTEKERAKILS